MHRHELSDADWKRIEPLLRVRPAPRSKRGDRDFVNAVIWRVKTGVPWRDLPERFGSWKTVYNRFSRWGEARRLGAALQGARYRSRRNGLPPRRNHRSGAPRRRGRKRGVRRNHLGRSRRGVSTKIHAVTTTQGKPLHVTLTQGHRHEAIKAEELVEHARGKACIADSGYDGARILAAIRARGMKPVVAPNGMRAVKPRMDRKRQTIPSRRYPL